MVPALGLAGCLTLAFALPLSSVVSGVTVLAVGAAAYGIRRGVRHQPQRETTSHPRVRRDPPQAAGPDCATVGTRRHNDRDRPQRGFGKASRR
ncbi:exported hypothetical protein [Frankia sp. AgKG'84/4]